MLKLKKNVNTFIKNYNFFSLINRKFPNYILAFQKNNFFLSKISHYKFSENLNNKENCYDTINKRYEYDYDAPEDSSFEYKSKLKKFIYFLFHLGLFTYGFYLVFLRKLNQLTQKRELYFINENIELKISNKLSKKIQNIFQHYIYKHDTEENILILKIYKNLLEKNNIKCDNLNKNNIFIIESESLGSFLLKNGDLFISSRLIDITQKNENFLAFFISCEIANQAMGLNSCRLFNIFFNMKTEKIFNKTEEIPIFSIIDKKFKELEYYNSCLLFYPDSVVMNYFKEKELMKIALKLLHSSGYDIFEVF